MNGKSRAAAALAATLALGLALALPGCASRDAAPGDPAARPMVALTFDDGPGPHTGRLLDALERHGARATFFVPGRQVEPGRDAILRAVGMGSEVAGHSWSHPELTSLSDGEIEEELRATSDAIERVTGVRHAFYRPPYGLLDRRVVDVSAALGYAMVNWTLDTNDWRPENQDADVIYSFIMREARAGSVVLMHDTLPATVAAMERAIPSLIERGFQLVTVSELLRGAGFELAPGRVFGVNWNM